MTLIYNTIRYICIISMFLFLNAYANQNVKYYEIKDNNNYTLIAQTEDTDSSYIPLDKRFWREFNGGQQHLITCNLKSQSSFVSLRDKPSSSSGKVIAKIKRWQDVKAYYDKQDKTSNKNGWVYISYNGKKGWVYHKYLCYLAAG